MSRKRALPTEAARKAAREMQQAGYSAHAMSRAMTKRRFKNGRGGRRWNAQSVRALLKRDGVEYVPHKNVRTSDDAISVVVAMADATIPETQLALERSGLRPARGGAWSDATIRRLRERYLGISTKRRSDDERFDANVVPGSGGCQLWIGSMQDGRGKFEVNGQLELAHRWNYERVHGPGSAGVQLHHTCRNPRCVNVGHLIPTVSAQEHAALEREEDAINEAAANGQLDAELKALGRRKREWPTWTDRAQRIGALRPTLAGLLLKTR